MTRKTVPWRSMAVLSVAAVAGLTLFLSLAAWQWGKAERQALEQAQYAERMQWAPAELGTQKLDPSAWADRKVVVRGHYEPQEQFFVDNRQHEGQAGVHVITPLRIEGSDLRILVNRGWLPWAQGRGHLPLAPVPQGAQEIVGRLELQNTKRFFLMPEHRQENPHLWLRADVARFERQCQCAVQPLVLLQMNASGTETAVPTTSTTSTTSDGLLRDWPAPENREGKHRSYAMQWLLIAAALLAFIVWRWLRRFQASNGS